MEPREPYPNDEEHPETAPEPSSRDGLVARSPAMLHVLAAARRYARLSWPVLILGESGTGKEGVARLLHRAGPRSSGPFVAVNAAALSPSLVDSELFGHERGAFTGATQPHRGVFEQAHRGTLFLDEIGELPIETQARLLRVVERWEVRRVGSERAIPIDVRLVCATHRDLARDVRAARFRADLYFRLHRLSLIVPPLRERPDDVVALAAHFLREVEPEIGPRALDEAAIERLLVHDWPGNARELRNVVTAVAAESASPYLRAADVERALSRASTAPPSEDHALRRVVREHGGNVAAAARRLDIPRSTLRDRLAGARARTPVARG